ncbi:MAG: hypothetical protein B7Y02_07925 [Rhodobacterales bacterium 17-64-5]|nr:MAG: hypothetical protein B7Y02_07925 [Rhodobacterales bacterium 17-64-5]
MVTAQEGTGLSLLLVDLSAPGVTRIPAETIDPSRNHATLAFADVPVEQLGAAEQADALIARVFDRTAVLVAFEQVGGSDRALTMARDYAVERMAFGRPIGSFQAIKHMLADMYATNVLARSNAYYGAWALNCNATELPRAAATARVSATTAYQRCARDNMQVHGGMGFTWELDCHLHYRRSNLLAVALGGLGEWENRLVAHIDADAQAA